MKILLTIVVIVALAIVGMLFYQGRVSASGRPLGLVDGKLARCPDKPNCVCSEYTDDTEHFIKPVDRKVSAQSIVAAVTATGGNIVAQTETAGDLYVHAQYVSGLFRFVDDIEFRLDSDNSVLHLRSASRVGHSDLGANDKRAKAIVAALVSSQG